MCKQSVIKKRQFLVNQSFNINQIKCLLGVCMVYMDEKSGHCYRVTEAAEVRLWRRMTKTSWTQRKTKQEILKEIEQQRSFMAMIEKTKHASYIVRHKNVKRTY